MQETTGPQFKNRNVILYKNCVMSSESLNQS